MRKLVSVLLTLAVVLGLSLTMAVPVAVSADAPPTIDGVVTTGEWAGATEIDVTDGCNGVVKVLAYTDYLYMLLEADDSTDNRIGEGSGTNDKTSVNINPTDGEPYGMPCDIIFEMGTDAASWGGTNAGNIDGYATNWVINGSQVTLPTDLEAKTMYTSSRKVTEWKIPLATIAPSAGDTLVLGGNFDIDRGGTPHYYFPDTLKGGSSGWADASTYAEVLVQGNTAVGLAVNVPDIVAINVDPTNIDFGTLKPGQTSDVFDITVANIGTHAVDVDADVYEAGLFYDNLELRDYTLTWSKRDWPLVANDLAMGASQLLKTKLTVPTGYTPKDSETATLIFKAKPMV